VLVVQRLFSSVRTCVKRYRSPASLYFRTLTQSITSQIKANDQVITNQTDTKNED
jgi:hypothetical protein